MEGREGKAPWQRGEDHWNTYGDSGNMTRGEFYARLDIIYGHLQEYDERLRRVEETINAPKNFLIDLFTTAWGRILLILSAVLMGYIISQVGYDFHKWID